MRVIFLILTGLLVGCGVQPDYVCAPSNCGGCCQENRCVGVSGGCGEVDGGSDAGVHVDAGAKDAGGPGEDAGTVVATIRYDYPKKNFTGCNNADYVVAQCEQTRILSRTTFDALVPSSYANCTTTKLGDTATIDCTGKCVQNTFSCSNGGTYNAIDCAQVPYTLRLGCNWDL